MVHELASMTRLRRDLIVKVTRLAEDAREIATAISGLSVFKLTRPNPPSFTLYGPSIGLLLQGKKRVIIGGEPIIYGPSHLLLTSIEVPAVTQAIVASPQRPYLGFMLKLDLGMVRELVAQLNRSFSDAPASGRAVTTVPITLELLSALHRLVSLIDRPQDIAALAGLYMREITYRLLVGPEGQQLIRIAVNGTQRNNTARVVSWLRQNYKRSVRIHELAAMGNMGTSTLHRHFHDMTSMSPLQYQKELRLHEARRLMLAEKSSAGRAARLVGYESAAQFSREYRRRFGNSPTRDIKRLGL